MKLATHRSGRALAIAALAATTGLVIAGCSSADPGSSSSDESFTIGIVEQQLANPFFANLQQSAVAAAEEELGEAASLDALVRLALRKAAK